MTEDRVKLMQLRAPYLDRINELGMAMYVVPKLHPQHIVMHAQRQECIDEMREQEAANGFEPGS